VVQEAMQEESEQVNQENAIRQENAIKINK